jgi:hypothetical protein
MLSLSISHVPCMFVAYYPAFSYILLITINSYYQPVQKLSNYLLRSYYVPAAILCDRVKDVGNNCLSTTLYLYIPVFQESWLLETGNKES